MDIGGVPIRGNEYYTRHMRYPRIVAWTSNKKFYRPMLRDFLHVRVVRLFSRRRQTTLSLIWVRQQTGKHQCHRSLNILERPRRVQRPSVYIQSPYTSLPPTMELPKKRVGRTKKNSQNDNLSPLNLGNAFTHDNVGGDDVLIKGVHDTVPVFFWRQLVPHLCMPRSHDVDNPNNEGWLSGDQINAWIEILVRSWPQDADWTVSKSGTACVHPENNRFLIQTDPHIIRMLDVVPHESERYWENIRYEMDELFYKCRCENTWYCGYD
nr:hypothetical protein [Tanacetum cinerariifolium]